MATNSIMVQDDLLFHHTEKPHLSTWLKNQVRQSNRRRSSLSTEQAANFQGLEFHTPNNCLSCLRLSHLDAQTANHGSNPGYLSADEGECHDRERPRSGSMSIVNENFPANGNPEKSEPSPDVERSRSSQCSPISLRKLAVARRESTMACIGSGESLDNVSRANSVLSAADGDGQHATVAPSMSAGDGFLSKVNQRKEVLKLIGGMNATVGVKTAEQGLLK